MRVENPFFWCTKADVVRKLANVGCAGLISQSFSCANVRDATRLGGRHCGVCSQCLDRRFAVMAAGRAGDEPADMYAVELFRSARSDARDLAMAEAYVLTAHRFAGSTPDSFLASYGEVLRVLTHLGLPVGDGLRRLHELHSRHGREVTGVITEQLRVPDSIAARVSLPDTSLLSMLLAPAATEIRLADPTEAAPSTSQVVRNTGRQALPRPIRFALDGKRRQVVFSGGMKLQGISLQIVERLLPAFLEGLRRGRTHEGFAFTPSAELAKLFGGSEERLRQQVRRLRLALAKQAREILAAAIDNEEVVESAKWSGYRLNPRLVMDMSLLEHASPRDVTTTARDVTDFP